MEVWLLWGLQPVAARGRERLDAVTVGQHGVQVSQGPLHGLLLPCVAVEHHLDAKGFLQQVCLKAGLPPDAWQQDATTLLTFQACGIGGRLAESTERDGTDSHGPKNGPVSAEPRLDRPAAVAGAFYPGRPDEIAHMLDEFFLDPPAEPPQPWPAALAPHAGWIYSGRLAAAVLRPGADSRAGHHLLPATSGDWAHLGRGAVWRWLIPGGAVEGDPELAAQLAAAVTDLHLDARPHEQEHAIEVQLPILARLAPQARVVGITVGDAELSSLCGFAEQLAGVLATLPERPLLLISSDMNHFADEARTCRLDRMALDAMASLDPARLFETVRQHGISMCGMAAAVIVMETLRQLGLLNRSCRSVTRPAPRRGATRGAWWATPDCCLDSGERGRIARTCVHSLTATICTVFTLQVVLAEKCFDEIGKRFSLFLCHFRQLVKLACFGSRPGHVETADRKQSNVLVFFGACPIA